MSKKTLCVIGLVLAACIAGGCTSIHKRIDRLAFILALIAEHEAYVDLVADIATSGDPAALAIIWKHLPAIEKAEKARAAAGKTLTEESQ